jgi:hypothetical protein
MKTLKLSLLAFLAVIFLSGCLQVKTTVNLNKDGSGTIEEIVTMKSEVINMMKEFAMSFDSTKSEEFNMFNETELSEKAANFGEGVKYLSGEKIVVDGYEGFKAVYSFTDINKIKLNPSPEDKVPFGDDLGEPETEVVDDLLKFEFKAGTPSTLVINFPKPQMKDEIQQDSSYTPIEDSTFTEDAEQKMMEMFDGMKMALYFNFKDGIDETDASFVDNTKVTLMEIDFSEIIKNKEVFKKFQGAKPETMEEFKEVVGDLEGIKVEFKEQVTIKF